MDLIKIQKQFITHKTTILHTFKQFQISRFCEPTKSFYAGMNSCWPRRWKNLYSLSKLFPAQTTKSPTSGE